MRNIVTTFLLTSVAACGGGGNNGGASSNADAQGIYFGTLNTAGGTDNLIGVIDANREAVFIDTTNAAAFRFSGLNVSGNSLSGSFRGYAGPGVLFANGSQFESGTASGAVQSKSAIDGSATASGGSPNSFHGAYQRTLYESPASFALIAGSYTATGFTTVGAGTAAFTITSAGAFSGSDSSGCTFSGTLLIPNPNANAYELSATVVCASNTLQVTGLAIYTPAASGTPAQLTAEYDNGSNYAAAITANKQ